MTEIVLLGTGGGRHTTMFQARSTGGFLIRTDSTRIHLDPGPGALTNMCLIGYDLRTTDAIMVSHSHPDHYSDAEVAIEGMTFGGWKKRGSLYGSVSVMEGFEGLGPCISPYHQDLPTSKHVMRPGDIFQIGDVRMEITRSDHNDPTTVGYKAHTPDGVFSYVTDTYYSDEIADQYKGSKVLFLPITTPDGKRIRGHMCTDDAVRFINRVRPELAVFVHIGIVMIKYDPKAQAARTERETGVKTLCGEDLMMIDMSDLTVSILEAKRPEWNEIWDLESDV